jgi:hypothetical protein
MLRRTRSLASEKSGGHEQVTTGSPERSGFSCTMVLTASFALSLVIGFLATIPA